MTAAIYLLQNEDALIAMRSKPYDSERLPQDLLAKYPNLLAGEQMDGENPRRWLLISQEVPVPAEEGAGGRWAADHLFLDQDGVPTIIEVKRCSDSRIRREVVGQMLDYAATGSVQAMGEFLGEEVDPEEFWQQKPSSLSLFGFLPCLSTCYALPGKSNWGRGAADGGAGTTTRATANSGSLRSVCGAPAKERYGA